MAENYYYTPLKSQLNDTTGRVWAFQCFVFLTLHLGTHREAQYSSVELWLRLSHINNYLHWF